MGKYTLPEMPYAYDALEPHIDARTMEIHHTKHHQKYTDGMNGALEKLSSELQSKDIVDILSNISDVPDDIRGAINFNGGGYDNHKLFWNNMKPNGGGEPGGALADAINVSFGSFADFKEQFSSKTAPIQGSGWGWLVYNPSSSKVEYKAMSNQTSPRTEGSILLIQRGSDIEGEIVYFSDKEKNAVNVGARAIIVYNNEPGIFFGELIHEYVDEGYEPTIPALSVSRDDGLVIREILQSNTKGTLDVFYHPDFVAYFSSRGPVSPFYIKPDLVAPGAFINTTDTNGNYKISSGTSFAAPHVAGTAALILQKNPELTPQEVKSILMTTTNIVYDQFNDRFPIEVSGNGRISASNAINAELIITPPNLIFDLSSANQIQTKDLEIRDVDDQPISVSIRFEENDVADFDYSLDDNNMTVNAKLTEQNLGYFESRIIINHNEIDYHIPVMVRVSEGAITVNEDGGKFNVGISSPSSWSYAKISVINQETGKIVTESITPSKNPGITVSQPGEYWIEAKIKDGAKTLSAYATIQVEKLEHDEKNLVNALNLPEKPILIIAAIMIVTAVVGLSIRRR